MLEAPQFYQNPELPCKQVSPGVMYPEVGNVDDEAISKSVCIDCDVQEICLAWAIRTRENFGTWGAHTAEERLKLARKIKRIENGRREAEG